MNLKMNDNQNEQTETSGTLETSQGRARRRRWRLPKAKSRRQWLRIKEVFRRRLEAEVGEAFLAAFPKPGSAADKTEAYRKIEKHFQTQIAAFEFVCHAQKRIHAPLSHVRRVFKFTGKRFTSRQGQIGNIALGLSALESGITPGTFPNSQ